MSLTKEKYEQLTPWKKGWYEYMESSWPESEIPEGNPYSENSQEYEQFNKGSFAASIDAQE